MRPAPVAQRPSPSPPVADAVFAAAVVAVAVLLGAVWAGAALAARLSGHTLHARVTDAGVALTHLPARLASPATAWPTPARSALPGPVLYWTAQALVLVAAAIVVAVGWRLLRPRSERDGLGVERSARFARRRDLVRLRVRRPRPGRIVLGRVDGTLVATEPRTNICVIGPSQSGKTTGLCVPVLADLDQRGGAVIAASVKGDLYTATHQRRAELGQVKVFDPTCVVVKRSATWSPLRAATTVTGAQAAARALVDLAGRHGLENDDFWMDSAKELLWPLFYVAAASGATMRDVVRWVTTHDKPRTDQRGRVTDEGEVAGHLREVLRRLRRSHDDAAAKADDSQLALFDGPRCPPAATRERPKTGPLADALLAEDALNGIWANDERTRSSIYTTARTVIEAWSDPLVATAAESCEITPEWLLGGNHTLYIVAPPREQKRFRPVFASMVADLVNAAFDLAGRNQGGELATKLLVLLDEAANICPVRELPAWCATCPSHGITLLTVWQDRSQQRLRYGREGAETVWNNSGAKLILSGLADSATAEVTRLLGEEDHQRAGETLDHGSGRRSHSTQTVTRPLVSEDSLRRQPPRQALLVYKDLPPMRLALRSTRTGRLQKVSGSVSDRFAGGRRRAERNGRQRQRLVRRTNVR